MRTVVLDACALIAFLERRDGYEKVSRLFEESVVNDRTILLCVVNWGEVLYHAERVGGDATARLAEETMNALPIVIVDVDRELARRSARLKVGKKMSYADCFAAALAIRERATLVTGDRDFEQIGNNLHVVWL